MTVIVALRRADGGISIAADKRVTLENGWRLPMADSKIGRVGDMLVGVCGSTAPGEIVLSMGAPERGPEDALTYLRCALVPELRSKIAEAELAGEEWGAMVVLDRRVFELDENGGVTEINSDAWAMGSGKAAALGCLYGLTSHGNYNDAYYRDVRVADDWLRRAVEVASTLDTTCGDGCDVIHGSA